MLPHASFTQNKKPVRAEGDLKTHILNLQMVKLSPREKAGFAEVKSGVMEDYNSYLLNHRLQLLFFLTLPYLIYESI